MVFETIKWLDDKNVIQIIDQTYLPVEKKFKIISSTEQIWEAIKNLRVRGAPLIGVSAAYGAVLAVIEANNNFSLLNEDNFDFKILINDYFNFILDKIKYISTARPTAVNLFWALNRIKNRLLKLKKEISPSNSSCTSIKEFEIIKNIILKKILEEAKNIHSEDALMCEKIGIHGEKLISDGDSILTHCNAGSMATSAWGTALAPIYKAFEKGKKIKVYSDETRPLLQGSRITAYELLDKGIETYTITDNMAGFVMKLKKVNKVIVGADRICSNGDFANKIGTYSIAILAKFHNIPFYVAAPVTTFDFNLKTGKEIPIEERGKEEIIRGFGKQTAPDNVKIFNPAFDVTPFNLVTAFITDKGIIYPPFEENFNILK